MRHRVSLAFVVLALLASTATVLAQIGSGYDLTWNAIDGGGGTAAGGGYRVEHTLGQPDAGTQSGGGYTLNGGFWAGAASGAVAPVLGYHDLYLPLILK